MRGRRCPPRHRGAPEPSSTTEKRSAVRCRGAGQFSGTMLTCASCCNRHWPQHQAGFLRRSRGSSRGAPSATGMGRSRARRPAPSPGLRSGRCPRPRQRRRNSGRDSPSRSSHRSAGQTSRTKRTRPACPRSSSATQTRRCASSGAGMRGPNAGCPPLDALTGGRSCSVHAQPISSRSLFCAGARRPRARLSCPPRQRRSPATWPRQRPSSPPVDRLGALLTRRLAGCSPPLARRLWAIRAEAEALTRTKQRMRTLGRWPSWSRRGRSPGGFALTTRGELLLSGDDSSLPIPPQGRTAEAKQSLQRARDLCPKDQGAALRKIDKALSLI